MSLHRDDLYADCRDEDAYNGDFHRMFMRGLNHSVRTTAEFQFAVEAPRPEVEMPPAGTVYIDPAKSVNERSRIYARINQLPGGAVEKQTNAERLLILKRNTDNGKTLTHQERRVMKQLAAPPKGAC